MLAQRYTAANQLNARGELRNPSQADAGGLRQFQPGTGVFSLLFDGVVDSAAVQPNTTAGASFTKLARLVKTRQRWVGGGAQPPVTSEQRAFLLDGRLAAGAGLNGAEQVAADSLAMAGVGALTNLQQMEGLYFSPLASVLYAENNGTADVPLQSADEFLWVASAPAGLVLSVGSLNTTLAMDLVFRYSALVDLLRGQAVPDAVSIQFRVARDPDLVPVGQRAANADPLTQFTDSLFASLLQQCVQGGEAAGATTSPAANSNSGSGGGGDGGTTSGGAGGSVPPVPSECTELLANPLVDTAKLLSPALATLFSDTAFIGTFQGACCAHITSELARPNFEGLPDLLALLDGITMTACTASNAGQLNANQCPVCYAPGGGAVGMTPGASGAGGQPPTPSPTVVGGNNNAPSAAAAPTAAAPGDGVDSGWQQNIQDTFGNLTGLVIPWWGVVLIAGGVCLLIICCLVATVLFCRSRRRRRRSHRRGHHAAAGGAGAAAAEDTIYKGIPMGTTGRTSRRASRTMSGGVAGSSRRGSRRLSRPGARASGSRHYSLAPTMRNDFSPLFDEPPPPPPGGPPPPGSYQAIPSQP